MERFDERGGRLGLASGFAQLDSSIGGFQPGVLYLFGATTGNGKSTFALHLAANIARGGGCPMLFSLEMSARAQAWRLTTNESLTRMADRLGANGQEARDRHERALEQIATWGITLCTTPFLSPEEIRLRITRENLRVGGKGVTCVLIDHVQLVGQSARATTDMMEAYRLKLIAEDLRAHAQMLGIPYVVMGQLNPLDKKLQDDEAHYSFRGSKDLPNTAEVVGLLTAKVKSVDRTARLRKLTLRLTKNRYGRRDEIDMMMDGSIARFSEALFDDDLRSGS
jgi:replicative DNA helicase